MNILYTLVSACNEHALVYARCAYAAIFTGLTCWVYGGPHAMNMPAYMQCVYTQGSALDEHARVYTVCVYVGIHRR